MQDVMQDLAVKFFTPSARGSSTLMNALKVFRIEEGPIHLANKWASIIDRSTKSTIRDSQRHYREITLDPGEDDEGHTYSQFDREVAPDRVSEEAIKHVMTELPRFVKSHRLGKKPKYQVMFFPYLLL